MADKIYPINLAKNGNQDGFCLPDSFFKDHPHLANASGYLEVLSDNTFLVKLNADNVNNDEGTILSLFLDFLMKDAIENSGKLVMYTQEMSEEIDDLVSDVILD